MDVHILDYGAGNVRSIENALRAVGANVLKVKSPDLLELDSLENGMLKDFYKDSKKVNNKKVKEFFNYQLTYPTYKEGLDKILNDIV